MSFYHIVSGTCGINIACSQWCEPWPQGRCGVCFCSAVATSRQSPSHPRCKDRKFSSICGRGGAIKEFAVMFKPTIISDFLEGYFWGYANILLFLKVSPSNFIIHEWILPAAITTVIFPWWFSIPFISSTFLHQNWELLFLPQLLISIVYISLDSFFGLLSHRSSSVFFRRPHLLIHLHLFLTPKHQIVGKIWNGFEGY